MTYQELEEINRSRPIDPCIIVIFGASGDLTSRKLMPALYNLAKEKQLPEQFGCIGFARKEKNDTTFQEEMKKAVNQYSRETPVDETIWQNFSQKLFYHSAEFHDDLAYDALKKKLEELDEKLGTKGNRVFYLSTPPSFFSEIVYKLSQHELIYDTEKIVDKWSRVVIEKPFGRNLQSAITLQKELTKHLSESQIYRIDHYLGKETVQNLLVFRFCNPVFEFLFNNHHVDNVQITVSEEIGIGSRGKFWEEAGMLRDIVQNHMMQLVSLIAMEAPTAMTAEAIHNEKIKVVKCIRSLSASDLEEHAIRGQYGKSKIGQEIIKGYREEVAVNPESYVETYVALQLFIDNWRWANVPFYLRAGKRLLKRATEITITFKQVPGFVMQQIGQKISANTLTIRIQPDEGIALTFNSKIPGVLHHIQPVKMDFKYGEYFKAEPPEAYERLICDCISGDTTLFARDDEVLASWKLLTPLLEYWQSIKPLDFPNYAAGSWGPSDAERLLSKRGKQWRAI